MARLCIGVEFTIADVSCYLSGLLSEGTDTDESLDDMDDGIVFFSRCRPQDSDPMEIVLRERRVFIGYPAWREGVEPERGQLRKAIVELRCSDVEWSALYKTFGKDRKQYQQNRNFVRQIEVGSIALVPRPSRGAVYAGRVINPFELIDDPPWGDDYLRLRRQQNCNVDDEFSHLADVAMCCEVDRFRSLPFPLIPAWIRRSLLGRSTYGRIWSLSNLGLELDPYPVLDRLLDHPERAERPWTVDLEEVERRLVDSVGPNAFEHACVALLQLEHPEHVWTHVGGSGDGGVDGIGADIDGKVVGLLQCKWAYWGEDVVVGEATFQGSMRQILAVLLHNDGVKLGDGIEFWSRAHIAALVLKHASRLPIAVSLRIGRKDA